MPIFSKNIIHICIFCFIFIIQTSLNANHSMGGQLSYIHQGFNNYKVTLNLDCDYTASSCSALDETIFFTLQNPSGDLIDEYGNLTNTGISVENTNVWYTEISVDSCIINQDIFFARGIYDFEIVLPETPGIYKIIYQRCCRDNNLLNIFNPSETGITYELEIPHNLLNYNNNSASFFHYLSTPIYHPSPAITCINYDFTYDYSAIDEDNDSLVYSLSTPFGVASSTETEPLIALPYEPLIWNTGYNQDYQLGGLVPLSIDPATGVLTGIPTELGIYMIGIQVSEYRNGELICTNKIDFQFNVVDCGEDCGPPIQELPFVTAFVFNDLNGNGLYDETNEHGLFNQPLSFLPSPFTSYTNQQGFKDFYFVEDTFTLELEEHPFWQLSTDSISYTITPQSDSTQYNFGLQAITDFTQVTGDLTSAITRCNSDVNYWLTYTNTGTTIADGLISLKTPLLTTFVNAIPPPAYEEDGVFYWEYENFLPSQQNVINIILQMPPVENIGAILESEATVVSLNEAEETISENKAIHSSELICGYDPNDKLVTPQGIGEENYTLLEDSLFQYTVRFQNSGNDTAFNVIIRDTLNANLNFESFQVISHSHELKTLYQAATGIIEFLFEDIYLPDSNVNESASHGFVKYQIKTKNNLAENTLIDNTAAIYFDLNPPIITNTTQNLMVSEIPLNIISINENNRLHLYPNPTEDLLFLDIDGKVQTPINIQIFDVLGNQIMLLENDVASDYTIDVSNYPKGLYFVQISIDNQIFNKKIVVQ